MKKTTEWIYQSGLKLFVYYENTQIYKQIYTKYTKLHKHYGEERGVHDAYCDSKLTVLLFKPNLTIVRII